MMNSLDYVILYSVLYVLAVVSAALLGYVVYLREELTRLRSTLRHERAPNLSTCAPPSSEARQLSRQLMFQQFAAGRSYLGPSNANNAGQAKSS